MKVSRWALIFQNPKPKTDPGSSTKSDFTLTKVVKPCNRLTAITPDVKKNYCNEISLTMGAGGLINWANFLASFH